MCSKGKILSTALSLMASLGIFKATNDGLIHFYLSNFSNKIYLLTQFLRRVSYRALKTGKQIFYWNTANAKGIVSEPAGYCLHLFGNRDGEMSSAWSTCSASKLRRAYVVTSSLIRVHKPFHFTRRAPYADYLMR